MCLIFANDGDNNDFILCEREAHEWVLTSDMSVNVITFAG